MASYSDRGTRIRPGLRTILFSAFFVTALGLLLHWVVPVPVDAAPQNNPLPASACAQCHTEALTQPNTTMAYALETVERSSVLIDHPLLTVAYGKYSYRIERKGNQSFYTASDGKDTVTMPILWALGASTALGQTYILEKDGELYESRMSWFQQQDGLGPTLGDAGFVPADVNEAAGRRMTHDDKVRCFGCHATDAVMGTRLTLDKMVPGVQCSHCHEATDAHLKSMRDGSNGLVIPQNLQTFTAEQASNFCGRCHRTWAEIAMEKAPSIANIRFQPYRLTGSKCYDPDDRRISCLACHNPHKELDTRLTDYDARCQACHQGGKPGAKSCPVAKSNCVTCHMPKIELPGGHYKFSDHRIRIVRPNEPYPG
jgi:hypothetical protein